MDDQYKVILTPVDGSGPAKVALNKAVKIARRNDAKLVLAFVVEDSYVQFSDINRTSLHDGMKKRGMEILEEHEKIANDFGITDVEKVIEFGVPKVKIANDIVLDHNIDLIIMGATGMSAIGKFLIGSTSEYVVRNAKCDVLITREN